ncbi:MAG: RibD family protein, partial [Gammaproteobacteria bacterium]
MIANSETNPLPHRQPPRELDVDGAWRVLLCAAGKSAPVGYDTRDAAGDAALGLGPNGEVRRLAAGDPRAVIVRTRGVWIATDPNFDGAARAWFNHGDGVRELFELYLPLLSAADDGRFVCAHLGQSLDGFVAAANGASHYVTGEANLVHLHRMRALFDAVLVGAQTVRADNPRLTARRVEGPNPLRVVLDPRASLAGELHVLTDRDAPTLLVHSAAQAKAAEPRATTTQGSEVSRIALADAGNTGLGLDLRALLDA